MLRVPRESRTQNPAHGLRQGQQALTEQACAKTQSLGEDALQALHFLSAQFAGVTFNGGDIDGGHGVFLSCCNATLHGSHSNYQAGR